MFKFKKNPFHDRVSVEVIERKNKVPFTVREYKDRYFFPDEWKAFYDCLKEKQKLTFNFLINTGARINEIRNVAMKDVDYERNNIVFRWTKSRNKDGSRRMRTIPISSQFSKFLKSYEKKKNLNLENCYGILSTPAANISMKKSLQKAKIPDWKMFSVHTVRKTTEMFLLALGVEATKVEKHMGHSLQVAMKYYVSPEIFSWEDKTMMRDIIGDLYQK